MNFKPSATGYNTYYGVDNPVSDTRAATYKQLLSKIRKWLLREECEKVCISRSRRGEWGEWFEWWVKSGNKIVKTKEGWM